MLFRYCPFTALFNATGLPSMSVPPGIITRWFTLCRRFGDEQTLLSLAGEL